MKAGASWWQAQPSRDEWLGIVHVHTVYSHDGNDTLEEVRQFALARNIRFVGLTDHAEDFTEEIFRHYIAECDRLSDDRVRLCPGLEFRFEGYRGLHLLAFNLRRWITPATPDDFMRAAPSACELTVAAHPILYRYELPPSVHQGIDAIEVWNATYNTRYLPDVRAIRMYQRLHRVRPELIAVAGLDQHSAANDREVRVAMLGGSHASPFPLMKSRRYMNVGRTMRFGPEIGWGRVRTAFWFTVRLAFDAVERVQERAARARRVRPR